MLNNVSFTICFIIQNLFKVSFQDYCYPLMQVFFCIRMRVLNYIFHNCCALPPTADSNIKLRICGGVSAEGLITLICGLIYDSLL